MSTTLAQISARCASSLVKKLSGSDTAKFVKFGITSKGQPWIVYQVGDRKCSQFLSKKEWDFAKSEVFFVSEIRIASDTVFPSTTPYLSGLYSVVNLRKNSQYDVSYYRRNETTSAITNCGCVAGQFKKNCKHQLLIKHLGDRYYDSMLVDREAKSVPVPVTNPTPSGYIHPAEKEADRVWADNQYRITGNSLKLGNDSIYVAGLIRRAGASQTKYVVESASYGTFLINTELPSESQPQPQPQLQPQLQPQPQPQLSQAEINQQKFDQIWNNQKQDFVKFDGRQAKRVSSLIADLSTLGTGYMIFETNSGNFLVKKGQESIATAAKVPDRIAAAVSQIKRDRVPAPASASASAPASAPTSVSSFPSVFAFSDQPTKVIWHSIGNDTWVSTIGGRCFSADLEANVRADLSLGLQVVCRTSKNSYLCSLGADGKILKVAS